MKITKLTYSVALALVCVFAVTGCGGHKVIKPTHIPGNTPLPPPDAGIGSTLPNAEGAGGGTQPSPESIEGMAADRAALAGYTVHFSYDSAAVKKAEHANIEAVAQALNANPGTKLMIEGNCDERGTEEYNRSLGDRRALAARKELVKMGIDRSRIMTKSFGKDKPVDPGHDESAFSKNRRADFILLRPGSGGATPNGS
jgi:peptidoglycan-associated lipoprotein